MVKITADKWCISPYTKAAMLNGRNWDGKNWEFAKDWHINIKAPTYEADLIIKEGFVSDGGSIPPPADTIVHPMGKYVLGFWFHDGWYGGELGKRNDGDWILLDIMQAQGADWIVRNGVYTAVDIGGGAVWAKHKKAQVKANQDLLVFNFTGKIPYHLLKPASNGFAKFTY